MPNAAARTRRSPGNRRVRRAIGVGISRAAFLPQITVSALGGYQRIASPFPSNLVRRGYITAQAQEILPELAIRYLLLDFGGGREATERAAEQISFAANVAFNGAHQKLIYTVARDYFVLDGARGQLRAAERALSDSRTLQQQSDAKLGRGLATTVEAQTARRATAQAQFGLAQAVASQHAAMYSLLQTLELPPITPLQVQDSSTRPLPRTTARTVDDMMSAALSQRGRSGGPTRQAARGRGQHRHDPGGVLPEAIATGQRAGQYRPNQRRWRPQSERHAAAGRAVPAL